MKYAVSILAVGPDDHGINFVHHAPGIIEAENRGEATHKAAVLVRLMYPLEEGFENHHVVVQTVPGEVADFDMGIFRIADEP